MITQCVIHRKSISNLFQLEMMGNGGKSCDVEHYPKRPYIEYHEKYKLGLVGGIIPLMMLPL